MQLLAWWPWSRAARVRRLNKRMEQALEEQDAGTHRRLMALLERAQREPRTEQPARSPPPDPAA